MFRVWQGNCYSKPAFVFLLASVLFTSTAGLAQEEEPGFLDRLFGSGKEASVSRADAANIAWKAELPAGLYDGDYRTCVALAGSEKLTVDSTVTAHFDRPAKITGAAVYVRRLSEEGDVGGEFLDKGFFWNSSLGKVSQLGTNASARILVGSPTTTSDIKFVITEVSAADTNVCLTELDVYGSFEEEENAPVRKTGLEGNWVVEYSDADKQRDETTYALYSLWPDENTATTGLWNYSACNVPASHSCAAGQITVSPGGMIQHQHGYGFKGLWGGFSTAKQVGPDEIRGQWNYQEKYGGAEVWRRVRPQITRVVLSSDVVDDFDPGRRPGRVEKTYNGFWGPTVDQRGNRPNFNIAVYGKNLWGRYDIRLSPRLDVDNLLLSDLEHRCCGQIIGPANDVVGLSMEVLAWAGAVPGRKTLYVDDIAVPFDFIVHGHPKEDEVVWPDDATSPLPKPPVISFLEMKGDAWIKVGPEGVAYGKPFLVEAEFAGPADNTPVNILLDWPGIMGPLTLTLDPVTNSDRLFRSYELVMTEASEVVAYIER